MEDFVVTCPLVSSTSHLISDSCSSPRNFGLGFLQPSPHDANLALLLAFGSANTWQEDFHLPGFVPCPAHTPAKLFFDLQIEYGGSVNNALIMSIIEFLSRLYFLPFMCFPTLLYGQGYLSFCTDFWHFGFLFTY